MEVGSWGKVGGMNVLTNGGDGLLGSVSANKIEAGDTGEGTTESSIEVDTQVKGEQEKRIMIICDDKVRIRFLGLDYYPCPMIHSCTNYSFPCNNDITG